MSACRAPAAPIQDARGLLNRWAEHDHKVIPAELCSPKVTYRCPLPGCGGELVMAAAESDKVRPHLRHLSGVCTSSSESPEHGLAKRVVAERLEAWTVGGRLPPSLAHVCGACGDAQELRAPFFGTVAAILEGTIAGRRADVLVQREGRAPIAVEVLVSHAVDDEKAVELEEAGALWVELRAGVILEGGAWRYTRGTLPHPPCAGCARAEAARAVAEAGIAEAGAAQARAEADREILKAEARGKAAEEQALQAELQSRDRTRAAKLIAANDAKAKELEASRDRVVRLTAALEADRTTLEGVRAPALAGDAPPAWTLPRQRFEKLETDIDAAKAAYLASKAVGADPAARTHAHGALCPRCSEPKLRRRPGEPTQLFCFGCGVAFEESR